MDRLEKNDIAEENDFDTQELDIINKKINHNNKIHDIIYDTIFEIKSYIKDNSLPMFEKFEYIDFFNLIEEQIKF